MYVQGVDKGFLTSADISELQELTGLSVSYGKLAPIYQKLVPNVTLPKPAFLPPCYQ